MKTDYVLYGIAVALIVWALVVRANVRHEERRMTKAVVVELLTEKVSLDYRRLVMRTADRALCSTVDAHEALDELVRELRVSGELVDGVMYYRLIETVR